jgi:parallel beta-helix repeat protein
MQKKTAFLLVVIGLASVWAKSDSAIGSNVPYIFVTPTTATAYVGEMFEVNVNISDAPEVKAWEIFLSFSPAILAVAGYHSGGFLQQPAGPPQTMFLNQSSLGYVQTGETLTVPGSANGSGTLISLDFAVLDAGSCALHLYDTAIYDEFLNPVPHTTSDGVFTGSYDAALYIRADGSIDPVTAPIQRVADVYTLTGDITPIDSLHDGIVIERDNVRLNGSGYALRGMATRNGIYLFQRQNISIDDIYVEKFNYGIAFDYSLNTSISHCRIVDNSCGIRLYQSSDVLISENSLTENGFPAIWIDSSSHVNILGNDIINNVAGIRLKKSQENVLAKNRLSNTYFGISVWQSSNNSIYGNNILDYFGVYESLGNMIYHNNFINSDASISLGNLNESTNLWDGGYPVGGNYWSAYLCNDSFSGVSQNVNGSDGIGDVPHKIDTSPWYFMPYTDRYPLMAPYNIFETNDQNGTALTIEVVTNSTISNFHLNLTEKTIGFNVTSQSGTGSCRITVPNALVQELWKNDYAILLDGEPCSINNYTDATHTYIYFNFSQSERKVTIVPEFSVITVLLFLTIATSFVIVLCKKQHVYNTLKGKRSVCT